MALPEHSQRAIDAVTKVSAVPAMLRAITEMTNLRLSLVAEVTDTHWVCCAVNDQLGFGLKVGGELDLHTTICKEVREGQATIMFGHASADPQWSDHATPKMYSFESYISVPIFLQDRSYFGNLCALDSQPLELTGRTRSLFEAFAALLGAQLDVERDRDTTSRALLDERATAELREQFIAVLGHDLRSPLGAIHTGTELLQMRLAQTMDPVIERTLGRMANSTQRMTRMIDDLADLARGRLGSGVAVTHAELPDLGFLVTTAVDEVRTRHSGPIAVELVPDQSLRADRSRVSQAITNLIGNAAQHGDKTGRIEVSTEWADQAVQIRVRNRGVTIPAERMSQMFEPFKRGEGANPQSGLGLGLFIVREIARAHGGSVECTSVDGMTTFTLSLPRGIAAL